MEPIRLSNGIKLIFIQNSYKLLRFLYKNHKPKNIKLMKNTYFRLFLKKHKRSQFGSQNMFSYQFN